MKGSIRKRGATWTAYWSITDPGTGKRAQHSKGSFRTKKAAQDFLNGILGAIAGGSWSSSTKVTVERFIVDSWLPSLDAAVAGGSLKLTTRKFYEDLISRYVVAHIGGTPLAALSSVQLNALYSKLLQSGRHKTGTGLSPTTVHSVHVAIHRMLRDAVKWGDLQRNVADQATAPRVATPKMSPWTPPETRAFIEYTSSDRNGALWRLLAMTGLRRGEVMGLQWADVDFTSARLTVTRTRSMAAGKIVVSAPKTESSSRTIGLDSETVAAVRGYRARQSAERLAAGEAWANVDDYIFADELGRPIHPSAVSKLFQEARTEAGLPKIRLHDLRHGYATAALEAGASMKVVSDRLGHSSITITADTYSHVRPEIDQALADDVARLIMTSGQ